MYRTCVIDNSTLVNLTTLYDYHIFNLLRNLFNQIHIPLEVAMEYEKQIAAEPVRSKLIDQMRMNEGFLARCSRYDSIVHSVIKSVKGIDAGEAGAAAQHKSVGSQYVLSDDMNFIRAIKRIDSSTKVLGTLHLIAWLDLLRIIHERAEMLQVLNRHSRFNSSQLRTAYLEISKETGVNISKKELSKKTSLKSLGIR